MYALHLHITRDRNRLATVARCFRQLIRFIPFRESIVLPVPGPIVVCWQTAKQRGWLYLIVEEPGTSLAIPEHRQVEVVFDVDCTSIFGRMRDR
jgi:hypothetical protein